MRRPPIFQISSITCPEECQILVDNIERLGGFYDNSKVYVSRATHLLIGSMSTTEKILCFISAGKWVLTKEYIAECVKQEKFVDENDFHVFNFYPESKLAKVSLSWMEKIRNNKTYPFTKWYIACFIEMPEKSDALKRIILAGAGRVGCFFSMPIFRRAVPFTLVICDRQFQESARAFASQHNLPWYPYEAIADFIMQGKISDKPILDLKYYDSLIIKLPAEITRPVEKILVPCCTSDYSDYLVSYEVYNELFIYKKSNSIKYFQIYVDDLFKNMWENKAFELSIDYIEDMDRNEMPSAKSFGCLLEFLMENSKDVKFWSKPVNAAYFFKAIYDRIYNYVLNKILNNPPSNSQLISYYDKVFEDLGVQFRIDDARPKTSKGIVDVLYLMSIHDYYIIKNSTVENRYKCLLQINRIEENSFKNLICALLKDKNTSTLTYHKLLQVIAFCSKHFKTHKICHHLRMNLNENKKLSTFEGIFSLLN